MNSAPKETELKLLYDKGERRHKHVGHNPYPEFRYEDQPRRRIGLCPNNISEAELSRLVNLAVPEPNGDRTLDFAKRLYVVHKGAIYRLETTDWGKSYHGFPYKGKLGRGVTAALRAMAVDEKCLETFEVWVDRHIEVQGK